MLLKDIKANERLITRLMDDCREGRVSHAYIFEGESRADKQQLARAFAKAILCTNVPGKGCESCESCRKIEHHNHSDILQTEAEGLSIKDSAVEDLQHRLRKKPFEGSRNIAIIKDADTMTLRAQNRLLKTLEEPPGGTVIMLLSENTENLTKTVLSRCVKYRVASFDSGESADMMKEANEIADMLLEHASFFNLKKRIDKLSAEKDRVYEFLDCLETVYRDLLLGDNKRSRLYRKEQIYDAVETIEEARKDLRNNIGTGYTLKNLMIKIGG